MARALLGKVAEDEIVIKTPEGERYLDVVKIWYK